MSTRATIHFENADGQAQAIIYRHSDGYPEGVGKDLERFFAACTELEGTYSGPRFGDPTYLAAKWIVWDSQINRDRWRASLDFLGIGVVLTDPGDIEYRYHVRCVAPRPTVRVEEVA